MRIIDWTAVAERFTRSTGDGQRPEAQPSNETLPSISVEELRTVMQRELQFQVVDARPRNYVSTACAGLDSSARRPDSAAFAYARRRDAAPNRRRRTNTT
jgi:hypothetical protein